MNVSISDSILYYNRIWNSFIISSPYLEVSSQPPSVSSINRILRSRAAERANSELSALLISSKQSKTISTVATSCSRQSVSPPVDGRSSKSKPSTIFSSRINYHSNAHSNPVEGIKFRVSTGKKSNDVWPCIDRVRKGFPPMSLSSGSEVFGVSTSHRSSFIPTHNSLFTTLTNNQNQNPYLSLIANSVGFGLTFNPFFLPLMLQTISATSSAAILSPDPALIPTLTSRNQGFAPTPQYIGDLIGNSKRHFANEDSNGSIKINGNLINKSQPKFNSTTTSDSIEADDEQNDRPLLNPNHMKELDSMTIKSKHSMTNSSTKSKDKIIKA